MENLDIVAILGTGISGFSFLMLLMGYKLTSDVQKKILDPNVLNNDLDKIKTWQKITDKQVINTRFFLGFSFIFLVAGLLMLENHPETKVILTLMPMEHEYPPIVYAQEKKVDIDENGKGFALMKNEHALTVDFKIVFKELRDMKKNLSIISASEKALVQQTANNSTDSGFGNIF